MIPLPLWMAQTPPNFYHVHGTEYIPPNTWISGNPPLPSGPMSVAAAVSAVVLLIMVAYIQRKVPWSKMSRGWRVLVLVCMVAYFFALWEISLQVCARRFDEPTFVPDPATFWKLNPVLARQWMAPNANGGSWWDRGIRPLPDRDSLKEKAPGCYRFMFFGESQLVSIDRVEVDIYHSYPHVLERLLAGAVPGRAFDAVNAGVPGFSSWQALMLCRQLVQYKPDLVVFAFGYHDASPAFASDRDVLTDNPRTHAVRSVLYKSELFLLMRKWAIRMRESQEEKNLREAMRGPSTFRVPLADFEQNLRSLVQLGKQSGFRVGFMFEPLGPNTGRLTTPITMYEYQAVMRKVAADSDCVILDVFNPMQKLNQPSHWNDDIHMSKKGHEAVAAILLAELQRVGIVPPLAKGASSPLPLPSGSPAP